MFKCIEKEGLPVPVPPYSKGEVQVKNFGIVNLELPTVNEERSWQLPKECKRFTLWTRNGNALRIARLPNHAGPADPPYLSLAANIAWSEANLDIDQEVIFFFACGTAAEVVQIIVGV